MNHGKEGFNESPKSHTLIFQLFFSPSQKFQPIFSHLLKHEYKGLISKALCATKEFGEGRSDIED